MSNSCERSDLSPLHSRVQSDSMWHHRTIRGANPVGRVFRNVFKWLWYIRKQFIKMVFLNSYMSYTLLLKWVKLQEHSLKSIFTYVLLKMITLSTRLKFIFTLQMRLRFSTCSLHKCILVIFITITVFNFDICSL